ncbi:hypothetical protein EDEG_01453 [Edhazardia aedis USNM 41457]|uniref:Symplekin C-terminal domain-containing protein n=1 Tax=Edhazardia aedis (strain USNM 41457) TaxID=1003232 RepID=J9D931_EDHAE|nr:hypothetical protein EDEG_01453 [Edhazardia aedis USNM 41457]|eukprot:EJW04281.1 hypothetical protein EDEG_01453 [Edhazardia aedis USNM 41457]
MLLPILSDLILVSLFDSSLDCRRAASTVLLELIGRVGFEHGSELLDLINFHTVKRVSNCYTIACKVINLIPELSKIIESYLFTLLSKYSVFETGKHIAEFVGKKYKCTCEIQYDFSRECIEIFYAICCIINEYNNLGKICSNCESNIYFKMIKVLNIKNFVNCSNFALLVKSYLKTVHILINSPDNTAIQNILFLLDKNIEPYLISKVSDIISDSDYKNTLLKTFARKSNEAYILSTTKHLLVNKNVYKKYITILNSNDPEKRAFVIGSLLKLNASCNNDIVERLYYENFTLAQSIFKNILCQNIDSCNYQEDIDFKRINLNENLKSEQTGNSKNFDSKTKYDNKFNIKNSISNTEIIKDNKNLIEEENKKILSYDFTPLSNFENDFLPHIIKSLNDYSVNIKGDIGYKIRRNALFFCLKNNLNSIFEKYALQYFADKSSLLRNDILKILRIDSSTTNNPHEDTLKFIEDNIETILNFKISRETNNFFTAYKNSMMKSSSSVLFEENHFNAISKNFNLLDSQSKMHVLLGLLATYKNSDGFAIKYMNRIFSNYFDGFYPTLCVFLGSVGRPNYLSIYFIMCIFYINAEIRNKYYDNVLEILDKINIDPSKIRTIELIKAVKEKRSVLDIRIPKNDE